MSMIPLAIWGAGGHAKVVHEIARLSGEFLPKTCIIDSDHQDAVPPGDRMELLVYDDAT